MLGDEFKAMHTLKKCLTDNLYNLSIQACYSPIKHYIHTCTCFTDADVIKGVIITLLNKLVNLLESFFIFSNVATRKISVSMTFFSISDTIKKAALSKFFISFMIITITRLACIIHDDVFVDHEIILLKKKTIFFKPILTSVLIFQSKLQYAYLINILGFLSNLLSKNKFNTTAGKK